MKKKLVVASLVVLSAAGVAALPLACSGGNGEMGATTPAGESSDGGVAFAGPMDGSSGDASRIGDPGLAASCSTAANRLMPVEVFSPSTAQATESVVLTAPAAAAGAPTLSMMVHNLNFQAKASVQVNDGAWIDLTNTTPGLTVHGAAAKLGGIGGSISTLKLSLALPTSGAGSFVAGANTVSFRLNKADGLSSGYRVVRLDALDASGASLLGALCEVDPSTWTAPAGHVDAASVDAGQTAWMGAALEASPLAPGTSLKAHCTDCHSQDGRDLKYFNFSNDAIIARAQFHGLSADQGADIAAFIRQLPSAASKNGRPWNPVYQPGPGTSASPISEWAAGAGIDAVLDEDSQAQAAFPGGLTDRDALMTGNRFNDVPIHDIPVSLTFLTWNQWLPQIHPFDFVNASGFASDPLYTTYLKTRQGLSGKLEMSATDYVNREMRDDLAEMGQTTGSAATPFSMQMGGKLADGGIDWSASLQMENYALAVWTDMKTFEIMQEFGLEGLGRQFYGVNGRDRTWFADRYLFNTSPRLRFPWGDPTDPYAADRVNASEPSWLSEETLASQWYELQLVLNSGSRCSAGCGFSTIDWAYLAGRTVALETASSSSVAANDGYKEPMRWSTLQLVTYEQHDDGFTPSGLGDSVYDAAWYGWNLRDNTPGYDFAQDTYSNTLPDTLWGGQPGAEPIIRTNVQMFLEKAARYPLAQWNLAMGGGTPAEVGTYWQPPPESSLVVSGSSAQPFQDQWGAQIGVLRRNSQVHEAALNGMVDFGEWLWPGSTQTANLTAWEALRVPHGTLAAPTGVTAMPAVTSVTVSWKTVANAVSYNVRRRASSSEAYMPVRLFVTGTSWTDTELDPGIAYQYVVSANDATNEGDPSAAASAAATAGMVYGWSFDGATAAVSSTGPLANDGLAIGMSGGPTSVDGKIGQALAFDGVSQFVSVPLPLHRWLGQASTFATWFRTSGKQANAAAAITGNSLGSQGSYEIGVVDASGHIGVSGWAVGEAQTKQTVFGTSTVNDGAWHHLAVTRSAAGVVTVYVDGTEEGSGTVIAGTFLSPRLFSIGRTDGTLAEYWQGALDDVRVYDEVLSASDVKTLATSTTGL